MIKAIKESMCGGCVTLWLFRILFLQGISDIEATRMIFYASIPQNGRLLRNISKTGCQIAILENPVGI